MNFLWINNFLKLGDTICFQRKKKLQVPDPEQEIFFFALLQIPWILYFVSAYALENQFSPHSSHEDSAHVEMIFQPMKLGLIILDLKILVIFILFVRQVRENHKDFF